MSDVLRASEQDDAPKKGAGFERIQAIWSRRKWLAMLVFASQSVADVAKSTHRDILIEQCPTKLFAPNPEAENTLKEAVARVNALPLSLDGSGSAVEELADAASGGLLWFSCLPPLLETIGPCARHQRVHQLRL